MKFLIFVITSAFSCGAGSESSLALMRLLVRLVRTSQAERPPACLPGSPPVKTIIQIYIIRHVPPSLSVSLL